VAEFNFLKMGMQIIQFIICSAFMAYVVQYATLYIGKFKPNFKETFITIIFSNAILYFFINLASQLILYGEFNKFGVDKMIMLLALYPAIRILAKYLQHPDSGAVGIKKGAIIWLCGVVGLMLFYIAYSLITKKLLMMF